MGHRRPAHVRVVVSMSDQVEQRQRAEHHHPQSNACGGGALEEERDPFVAFASDVHNRAA